jgi:hypothetical protein
VLAADVAALAQHIEEQDGALPGVEEILLNRVGGPQRCHCETDGSRLVSHQTLPRGRHKSFFVFAGLGPKPNNCCDAALIQVNEAPTDRRSIGSRLPA